MRFSALATASAVLLMVTLAAPVSAQVPDHLKCYKIKDPVRLAAVVDLDSPQFGLEAGCEVKAAQMFCVPATKTVISAIDKKTGLPITPLPITGPDPGDRICYKIKCPEPFPPDTEATDQFGTRTLTKFKTAMLCVPAVKGGVPPMPTGTPATSPTPIPTGQAPTTTPTPPPPPRFVDNVEGTVTDTLTSLQWEKKTTVWPSVHYWNSKYTWTASGIDPDGTAFTDFLATLNTPPCFAGHCDWRLPTVGQDGDTSELETLLLEPYPCGTHPCIAPIFGPTLRFIYWSATTDGADPALVWVVDFEAGGVGVTYKLMAPYDGFSVRAVRSGPPPPPLFVDNGNGTVTDTLTGLQWEKKTVDGGVHGKDNKYTWTASGIDPDGTAFTDFLATLNTPPCFAGHCDWRLPTVDDWGYPRGAELETILDTSEGCLLPPYETPCIAPTFGPTAAGAYWSGTTATARPTDAYFVNFGIRYEPSSNAKGELCYVRAVRSGS